MVNMLITAVVTFNKFEKVLLRINSLIYVADVYCVMTTVHKSNATDLQLFVEDKLTW